MAFTMGNGWYYVLNDINLGLYICFKVTYLDCKLWWKIRATQLADSHKNLDISWYMKVNLNL